MPTLPRRPRPRGLSLIELLMFIVVVGIALAALLKVFVTATIGSADPMIRRQQLAIAESLLREVELMNFTWCDPESPQLATANSAADCAGGAENSGPETGETRYGPTYFDNVNDYAGFSMSGIRDATGTVLAGLSGYGASVAVTGMALDSVAAGEALKITVTVTAPNVSALSLQGWRTRYAPNDAN
ncbi:type IV pilus modification PilV family protein [Roseateles sp. NT4]|uniref:type IV pilus modification PilV family protein n=1 Tax=Roseateles sp. NT4 TaxID=3453715 RepID=UPI003EED6B05